MNAFIGEIKAFPYSFAPAGWEICDGRLLSSRQYQALFSILSTRFGGDGFNTFGIPNLLGKAVISSGAGPGLQYYQFGNSVGAQNVQLTVTTIPPHTHSYSGATAIPNSQLVTTPANNTYISNSFAPFTPPATGSFIGRSYAPSTAPTTQLNAASLSPYPGSGQAHTNMMPSLEFAYCICVTEGEYPVRP